MSLKLKSSLVIILYLIQTINSTPATTPSLLKQSESDLISSIDKIQKKYSEKTQTINSEREKQSDNTFSSSNIKNHDAMEIKRSAKGFGVPSSLNDVNLKGEGTFRQDKMLGYFGYYPQPQLFPYPIPTPTYYPSQQYYEDYSNEVGDEEILSRANGRRRPQNGMSTYENSPIYYVRLPPTPYMFVPGYGYISQPPTIQPMSQMNAMPHLNPMNPYNSMNQMGHMTSVSPIPSPSSMSPLGINPFINLPVNFVSNGKPTNVYQWSGTGNGYQPNSYPQLGYLPQRPQRPIYKQKPYNQDSKITHLKGQYVFNGRPEDVYVLQNPYNSIQSDPSLYHYY